MSKGKDKNIYYIGGITVLIIIDIWLLNYNLLIDLKPEERGTIGDMFGTINALFSGLALAGIIFTILLQRKELGYQRDELRETRKEFIIQNKTLKAQRFETTFFNLLLLHNQIVNDIDYDKPVSYVKDDSSSSHQIVRLTEEGWPIHGQKKEKELRTVKGRDVFRDRFNNLNTQLKNSEDHVNVYLDFYEARKTDFGHYFRNLYRIIKMVHETEFKDYLEIGIKDSDPNSKAIYYLENFKERYKYTSVVRAQLSDYELLFLFYNCLSPNGSEKFKPLVEEYALLKNLPRHDIYNQSLLEKFKDSAYKNKNESLYDSSH